MRRLLRGSLKIVWLLVSVTNSGCIATAIETKRLTIGGDSSFVVTSPAKAQLTDGSIVVFSHGSRVQAHRMIGEGWRFPPGVRDSEGVASVSADSIAAFITFRTTVDPRDR